jgi:uncharacterized repeat protein (TIGR01451 family)
MSPASQAPAPPSPAALDTVQGQPIPNPGFTADLSYGTIYGFVGPGDVVTATRTVGGAAYGAAEADDVGFFWTLPYDGAMNGRPVGVAPGDTYEVYVNGVLAATLDPLSISGAVDVLADDVTGNIADLATGTQVTVTLGEQGRIFADEPMVVTTVDAAGDFTAGFSGIADIGPQMMAQVRYRDGAGNTVLAYVYPSEVFCVRDYNMIQGYADPFTTVTATVYVTYPTDVRWSGTAEPNWPHGWYNVSDAWVEPGDTVELELPGGAVLQLDMTYLDLRPDAAADELTGYAPAGETVRAYVWNDFDGIYAEASAVANTNWAYTITLPIDLQTRHWSYAGYADAEGDEIGIFAAAPHLRAYPPFWRLYAVAPQPHTPVTYTLQLASGTFVEYNWCGWNNSCGAVEGYELLPGDTIIAEFPMMTMSMDVADVGAGPDTGGNAIAGTVDRPGFLEAVMCQWGNEHYPAHGCALTTGTVSGSYNLPFDAFDVRDGMGTSWTYFYEAATGHRTFNFLGSPNWETAYFEVNPPYGVGGVPNYPDEGIVVRLYEADGTTLLAETGDDHDGDPWSFWFDDFQGHELLPGRWIELAGDSGWNPWLQIPEMTVYADAAADMVWGQAPKSQVRVDYSTPWGWDYRWVPVDDYVLDLGYMGVDLLPGDQVWTAYQAVDGNRVSHQARLGELFRVEFWLEQNGPTWLWGEAQPGEMVTITTPYTQVYAFADPACSGCWDAYVGDLFPGDAVNVIAGAGLDPVDVTIADPFTAEADSNTDEVWGQIGGWYSQTVEVHGEWGDGYREVTTDLSGNYLATYPDVPRGAQGYVRYVDAVGYTEVIYHRPFHTPDLLLNVNYGHDWIEGNYEPGHTLWLTVTDGFGDPKATAELQTQQIPWWPPDQTGFSTNLDNAWVPGQPDMVPGDWVFAQMDNGQMAEVRIGEITGALDIGADTIGGNVYADWFTDTLHAYCAVWEDGGPWQDFWVDPDGGAYFCDFQTMDPPWDVLPGHDVGVEYQEPDGDWVINMFEEPAPDINVQKWAEGSGQAYPGGPVVFGLYVQNQGWGPASQVILTDTLPANAFYTGDSSGVTPTPVGNLLVWDLGPMDPGDSIQFYLYLENTASAGETVHNVADAWAPFDENPDNNHAEADADVVVDTLNLYVNKDPQPGDPAAGETMLWSINYGNDHPVASGAVTLIDTVPAGTTIVEWWSDRAFGWTEVAAGTQLILDAPSIPGHWNDQIYMRLALDPGLQPGTQLTNTVEIITANDDNPDDNWHVRDDVWVAGEKRWDAHVEKDFGWGILVPGGEVEYNLHVRNQGNAAASFTLTDTLPAGTSFAGAWQHGWSGQTPFPPDYVDDEVAVWDLGVMEPGDWINFGVRLAIDPDTPVGTVLENCAHVAMDQDDGWPFDNESCLVHEVNPFGPNVAIEKWYQWNGEGQLEYRIQVRNLGTEELFDVVISDTLPVDTAFNGNWWHDFWEQVDLTYQSADELAWTLSRLEPGWGMGLNFQVDLDGGIVGQGGLAFENVAEVWVDGDVAPGDNVSAVTAYSGPDLYIDKWHSDGLPVPGALVTFTVEFGNANRGPWGTQANTHLTDTLPAGMTFYTATAPWNPDDRWHPEMIDGNTIVWGWGNQDSGNTWFFDLVVEIDPAAPSGDVLINTIENRSDDPGQDVEYNYANNLSEAAITVLNPILEVTKGYETTGYVGDVVTYTLLVENNGNLTATNVIVSDTLPAGLTYGGGGDSFTDGDVMWTVPDIPPGDAVTVWFWATIDATGTIVNDQYRVVDSDQGVKSDPGPPVSFPAEEPIVRVYLPIITR